MVKVTLQFETFCDPDPKGAPKMPPIEWSSNPPPRHTSLPSIRVAEMRESVGHMVASDAKLWQRAVSIRDPVTILKRTYPHVNRATFKMHEITGRLFPEYTPRNAVFLAEAPGGFLYAARQMWPQCDCRAMSSTAPNDIVFAHASDPGIMRDLPHDGDLLKSEVHAALVERCGLASVDFVSADGGTDVASLPDAEQHSMLLALAQLATGLAIQAVHGCLVLKLFEGCTLATRQLFEIVRGLYKKIMLFKPLSSKVSNSERYVVAIGLKSPAVAKQVSEQLRFVIERCRINPASTFFVASLGIDISELTHQAFDLMATEQAEAIGMLLRCIDHGRTNRLRSAATNEAKRIEALFGQHANRDILCRQ